MTKFAYLIDSSLAPNLQYFEEREDYFLLPLYAVIDGELYKDMLDISAAEFYEKVRAGSDVKTTQASASEYLEKYEEIRDLGYTDIFMFSMSSEMSGTINAARTAADMVENVTVHVIDSKTIAAMGAGVVEHISEFGKTCTEPQAVIDFAEEIFERADIFVVVNSLDSLRKGGRISPAKAMIGQVLNIKPVLIIHHGVIDVIAKERTLKKSAKKIIESIGNRDFHTGIIFHSNHEEMCATMIAAYEEAYPNKPYVIRELSPVVGVHAGSEVGAIGLIWDK